MSATRGWAIGRALRKASWLVALAVWVIAVRYRSFDLSFSGPDESLFILIGQGWLVGDLPYVAIWDVKPPGLFLLYALSQWLIGPGILAVRVLTAVAVFAGSLALFDFCRRHLRAEWMAPAAAVLYPIYSIILDGLRGRPETLLAPLVIQALSLALTERTGDPARGSRRVILAGLLFGLAVMIKQTAVFEALVAAGLVSIRLPSSGKRPISWLPLVKFVVAGLLPSACFIGYFAATGADAALYLTPFLGAAHRLRGDGITFAAGLWRFLPMCKPILPLFVGGLLLVAERRSFRTVPDAPAIRAIVLWMAASAAGAMAMRSMYFPYFAPLVPPLLLASLLVLRAWLAMLVSLRAKFALTCAVLIIVGAYPFFWFRTFEPYDSFFSHLPTAAARAMHAAGLRSEDSLYVADEETTIYLFAGARLATRYIESDHLVCDFTLPDTNPDAEIRRIMESVPRFVVISHTRRRMVCERPDRIAIVDAYLARSYRLLTTISEGGQSLDIYCRDCVARRTEP